MSYVFVAAGVVGYLLLGIMLAAVWSKYDSLGDDPAWMAIVAMMWPISLVVFIALGIGHAAVWLGKLRRGEK